MTQAVAVARLGLAIALIGPTLSQAQAQPPATAAVPDVASAPYVDRVIDGLAPLASDDEEGPVYDRAGWPRYLRIDARVGSDPFRSTGGARLGIGVYGQLDTPNHGALSIDGNVAHDGGLGTATLRQRGMPLAGGWIGSHEAGIINTPQLPLLQRPSRVFLPSAILRGASGEWDQAASGLQLQVSTGRPGLLETLPDVGFTPTLGRRDRWAVQWAPPPPTTGASVRAATGLSLGLLQEAGRGVGRFEGATGAADAVDATSTLAVAAWQADRWRVQMQALQTRASHLPGDRQGFWADAELTEGPRRHAVGAYRLDADLSWAQLPVSSNLAGVYGRTSWATRQWSAEGSLDWLRSVSGPSRDGVFASGSARWRIDRTQSVGWGGAWRSYGSRGWSAYADWRTGNAWGSAGLRLQLAGGQGSAGSRELSYDQAWTLPQGWSLSTSLGLRQVGATDASAAERSWVAALNTSAPLSSRASARANVSTEHSSQGRQRHSINAGAVWRIAPRWSLEGYFTRSVGRSREVLSLDPLAPPTPFTLTTADRSFLAVLRYELQAGSRTLPLGGNTTDGGGRVEGVVYFDANRNGTREASETGAPGVTVTLDNRYATRTDAQGRFVFAFVGAGARTVGVRNDTLPLPWSVVNEGQARIDVRARDAIELNFPVQRNE